MKAISNPDYTIILTLNFETLNNPLPIIILEHARNILKVDGFQNDRMHAVLLLRLSHRYGSIVINNNALSVVLGIFMQGLQGVNKKSALTILFKPGMN